MNDIESKKNELNLEIRSLLAIIDMIDGISYDYPNYEEGTLNESDYLDQQRLLVADAKDRLMKIFKD